MFVFFCFGGVLVLGCDQTVRLPVAFLERQASP